MADINKESARSAISPSRSTITYVNGETCIYKLVQLWKKSDTSIWYKLTCKPCTSIILQPYSSCSCLAGRWCSVVHELSLSVWRLLFEESLFWDSIDFWFFMLQPFHSSSSASLPPFYRSFKSSGLSRQPLNQMFLVLLFSIDWSGCTLSSLFLDTKEFWEQRDDGQARASNSFTVKWRSGIHSSLLPPLRLTSWLDYRWNFRESGRRDWEGGTPSEWATDLDFIRKRTENRRVTLRTLWLGMMLPRFVSISSVSSFSSSFMLTSCFGSLLLVMLSSPLVLFTECFQQFSDTMIIMTMQRSYLPLEFSLHGFLSTTIFVLKSPEQGSKRETVRPQNGRQDGYAEGIGDNYISTQPKSIYHSFMV